MYNKTFEEVQKEVDKKIEQLHKIDEEIKNGTHDFNLDKIKPNHRKYARRIWNGKKRIRELEYRSIEPDDYHDREKHKNDRF